MSRPNCCECIHRREIPGECTCLDLDAAPTAARLLKPAIDLIKDQDKRITELEAVLIDFRDWGTRRDLNPTCIDKTEAEFIYFLLDYLKCADDYVRERAGEALK